MRQLFRSFLVAGVIVTSLAISATAPLSQVALAADLKFCGPVSSVLEPTALTPGALTIGGLPFVLLPGTSVPAAVHSGANVCLDMHAGTGGSIDDIDVSANSTSTIKTCGKVNALTPAGEDDPGSIKVDGRSYPIAAGSDLPPSVDVGDDTCFDMTLNGFGQISDATVKSNVTSTATVCGRVSAYTAADSNSPGSLKIDGKTYRLAPGSDADASIDEAKYVRAKLTFDGFRRVQDIAVTKIGDTADEACSAATTPTAEPTPRPTPRPTPSPSPEPTASPTPIASSPSLGAIVTGAAGSADPSASPDAIACVAPIGAVGSEPPGALLAGIRVPDTESIARTGWVLAANAVPLVLVAMGMTAIGWVAGWRDRRRGVAGPRGASPASGETMGGRS